VHNRKLPFASLLILWQLGLKGLEERMVDPWAPYIAAIFGLAGVIIGAITSTGTQVALKWWERSDKRKSLAYSVAGEIESYLDLMDRRGHVRNAEELVRGLRSGSNLSLKLLQSQSEKRVEYFPIFQANLSNIGVLGREKCSELARFHRGIAAVLTTMDLAGQGEYEELSAQDKANVIEGDLEIWRGAINTGRRLVKDLYAN
jgi:hypothetical protein